MSAQFGQYPPPRQVIVHLSDTHFLAEGARLYGTFDTEANLAAALAQIEAMGIRPAALVFTGDLTDLGEPDAYRRLRAQLEPFATRLGTRLVLLPGNHDERAPMRSELLDEPASDDPIDRVWDLDGLRLIGLDSSVPGYHHGDLSDAQLEWLDRELSVPAPHGTIIALHHPPIPVVQPIFELLELRDQQRLAAVLDGRDVRAILGGHLHYAMHSLFAGIPVSVAAATCYTMNLSRPPRLANGMNGGQSFQLVHVYDDRITHSVVPIGDYPTADTFTEEFMRELEALSPEERFERFSRKV